MQLLFVIAVLASVVTCQQNLSDALTVKYIELPLTTVITGKNTTFCDAYVPANESQYSFMYKLVERAFVGDYAPVPAGTYQGMGILNPNAYYIDPIGDNVTINLLPYFNGSLKSNNRCGEPTAVKFVYGASGIETRDGVPSVAATYSGHKMITHIAQWLGVILGCDAKTFPTYDGVASQSQVHRFMDLKAEEMHYFIHNIVDSANTAGVTTSDGVVIGTAIDNMFNKLCSPPRTIIAHQGPQLQDMCFDKATCANWTLANPDCPAYNFSGLGVPPAPASSAASDPYKTSCDKFEPLHPASSGGYSGFKHGSPMLKA